VGVRATGVRDVRGEDVDSREFVRDASALQSPIFVPGTGSLVRVEADGTIQTVVSNLVFPSGLTRGADGAFYVSECGYHCQPGDGRILRVAVE
jgi:hypothetical protein